MPTLIISFLLISTILENHVNSQESILADKQWFYIAPIINKQVFCIDMIVQIRVTYLKIMNEKLNLQLQWFENLAKQW